MCTRVPCDGRGTVRKSIRASALPRLRASCAVATGARSAGQRIAGDEAQFAQRSSIPTGPSLTASSPRQVSASTDFGKPRTGHARRDPRHVREQRPSFALATSASSKLFSMITMIGRHHGFGPRKGKCTREWSFRQSCAIRGTVRRPYRYATGIRPGRARHRSVARNREPCGVGPSFGRAAQHRR